MENNQINLDDILANNKGDIYKQLASKTYDIPYDKVTQAQRLEMKAKYGMQLYGCQTGRFSCKAPNLAPNPTVVASIEVNYCPKCGTRIHSTEVGDRTVNLLHSGRVYQCFNCGTMYMTGFSEGSFLKSLSEDEYRYIVDENYHKERDAEDLKRRIEMEEAYSQAAKQFNYDLPENYVKEED